MKPKAVSEKPTDRQRIGLGNANLALIADLPGTATHGTLETPQLVEERWKLSLEKKRAERRLEEIDAILKQRTGERQVGDYLVNVSSYTTDRVDTDAVKELLGDKCPMKATASVRLTVVPA